MSGGKKVFVIAWGSMGDVHPLLGIAVALKSRGHRVTFVTNAIFREMAEAQGLGFHSIGTLIEAQMTLNNPDLWHPRKGFGVVWRSCVPTQKLIADYLVAQPDAAQAVVIAHPLALPGALTARDCTPGLKLIGTYLAPSILRTCHDPLWLGPLHIPRWVPHGVRRWLWRKVDSDLLDPLAVPDINALRAAHGLPPIRHYLDTMYRAPDFSLTLFPEWFGPAMPDWPTNLVRGDFVLFDAEVQRPAMPVAQDELQRFLDAGEPPIVFTFGSAMQHADKAFAASRDACLRLGRRGIFLSLFGQQIPHPLPATIKWFEYASFRHLLPKVAAVVHHGGIGSTAEALRAGVPQVVVPMAYDQFDNGARIEALGVGAVIARRRYRAAAIAGTLDRLLDSASVRRNCREVAARFGKHDPAQDICRLIEDAL